MRIRRNRDNKIKIPWYVRRVPIRRADQVDYTPADFGFRFPVRARPQPVTVAEPITQPATEPVTETGRIPFRVPEPTLEPSPVPEFPGIPFPGRLPGRSFPVPEAPRPPFRQPEPVPGVPGIPFPGRLPERPAFYQSDPQYDWEAHYRRIAEQYEQTLQSRPEPVKENVLMRVVDTFMKPIMYLTVGKVMLDHYVEAKITDPIYSKMLETPVLGDALREAERAGMDVEVLANYFANYDWDNMDIDEMLKDLTALVGAAAAARIIVFFVGRKVVFRV